MYDSTSSELIKRLGIESSILDSKKEQTTMKIKYVKAYVEKWLRVMTAREEIESITFIDAMCNAGIYADGGLCTAAEVAKLFGSFAEEHPNLTFRLYINDSNRARMESCVKICKSLIPVSCSNVIIVYANMDVNAFLHEAAITKKVPSGYGDAILLFVDPYDMGTVHYGPLRSFIGTRYCELLFNYFSSDLRRNHDDVRIQRIVNCFDDLDIPTHADVAEAIAEAFRVGKMKYVFSYPFRISTNTELYQIIFVTPHVAGLEKLKEALWDTFDGAAYYRNTRQTQPIQGRLFSDNEMEDLTAMGYSEAAKEYLLDAFAARNNVPYAELSAFLLERTMLREGQFLDYVVKPLLDEKKIYKDGRVSKKNYKKDTYTFAVYGE